jgi:CBS domain-containing protein
MHLRDVLEHKGRNVFSCTPDESLEDVVHRLVDHNVGSLVVMEHGRMVGIITERDILRACHDGCAVLQRELVVDRMTLRPVSLSPEHDISEAMDLMTERRIRHLPVTDQEQLLGIISIGDLVKAQQDELARENHYLKSYIQS